MQKMIQTFKQKVKDDVVIGCFSKTSDPAFIECMGYSGADFVILDLEHGPNSVQTVQNLIRAAQISGVFPIVRVKEENPSVMSEVLDIGAGGIQVPQICSAEDALKVRELTKFAPLGQRGVCRFVRAAKYSSKDKNEYFKDANDAVTVLQIEGKAGIENLPAIIDTKCADIVFIGPYDLSQAMGVTGQIDHPLVEKEVLKIVSLCKENDVAVGIFVDTLENAKKWSGLGVKYLAYSVDVGIFSDAVKSIITNARKEDN